MSNFDYWKQFRDHNFLSGTYIEIPKDQDLSKLGADLEIFDDEGIRSETEDVYPGLAVCADGYVPIAGCQAGAGDPYFIKIQDGEGGPLYRIYHDMIAVTDDGSSSYDAKEAVDKVLEDYRDLLNFRSK